MIRRLEDPKALAACRLLPCIICGGKSDAAHIKTKGSGGHDVHWNLIPLCRSHHQEQHRPSMTWPLFMRRYFQVERFLRALGWYIDERGKLWNDLLNA